MPDYVFAACTALWAGFLIYGVRLCLRELAQPLKQNEEPGAEAPVDLAERQ